MNAYSFKEFDRLVPVMEELGKLLIQWRNDESAKKIYSKSEFKTEADRRSHEFIAEKLKELFPGILVISEEDAALTEIRPDKYWLIDPIDGTASWYEGFDGFVTQAAYIESGMPVYGLIHCPVTKQTWTALKGRGARINGMPMKQLSSSERLILVDNTAEPHGITQHLFKVMEATGYRESGSLGLKSVLVANGNVDLFVKNVKVRDWDMAPVAAILNEVGGCMSLPNGNPYEFTGSMLKPDGVIVARDSRLLAETVKKFSIYNAI